MKYHSEYPANCPAPASHCRRAFTLVESVTAVVLLVFITASVWVVLEHCMVSAADTTQRMCAFEIARGNMEKLLDLNSVQETAEYGTDEKFPDIRWQTTVERFYEPVASHMWIRAVCLAEYTDSAGETRNVELTNWLTELTDEQVQKLAQQDEAQRKLQAKYIIETEDTAAQYAGVDVKVLQQWVRNGMPTAAGGGYLRPWLDLYLATNGSPSERDKEGLISRYPDLAVSGQPKSTQDSESSSGKDSGGGDTPESVEMSLPK